MDRPKLHIDEFMDKHGHYVLANGCTYEDEEQVLGEFIKTCGCGRPRDAITFAAKMMRLIAERSPEDAHRDRDKFSAWYREHEAKKMALMATPEALEFVGQILASDHLDLMEHGSSHTGSWLTKQGLQFCEDVEAMAPVWAAEDGEDG